MIQKAKVAKAFISVIALFAFVYWGLDPDSICQAVGDASQNLRLLRQEWRCESGWFRVCSDADGVGGCDALGVGQERLIRTLATPSVMPGDAPH